VLVVLLAAALAVPALRWDPKEAAEPSPRGQPVLAAETSVRPGAGAPILPNLTGWWSIPTVGPSPRTAYQMAYDSEDRYVLLFGGCPVYAYEAYCGSGVLGDTWSYANGTWTNLTATLPLHPSARSAGVMADDPAVGGVILYGGRGPGYSLTDTWEWTSGVWIRLTPRASPPALTGAAIAFDAADSALVLTGGTLGNSTNMSPSTWVFEDGNWTNATTSSSPAGWFQPALAPNPIDRGVLLFGGVTLGLAPTYSAETWSYLDGTWSNQTMTAGSSTPGPRVGAAVAFDPVLNSTILSGGSNGVLSYFQDLWEYSASNRWTPIPVSHEPDGVFFGATAAWDAKDGYLVAFGDAIVDRSNGPPSITSIGNSTWALLTAIVPTFMGPGGSIPSGATASFLGSASGGLAPYRYAWDFGDGSAANGSTAVSHMYSGAGTFTVTFTVTDAVGQSASFRSTVTVSAPASAGALELELTGLALGGVAVAAIVLFFRRRKRRAELSATGTPGAEAR